MLEPKEIKVARRSLGLTQAQLALRAGVSQSFIAKLELGLINPSFTAMQAVSSALEGMRRAAEKKAVDVMHRGVISISLSDSPKIAAQRMRSRGISQLPVLVRGRPVGLVTESDLLDVLVSGKQLSVSDVMKDAPPVVAPSAGISAVRELLHWWPMVLVGEKGRIVGAVTKSDLIGAL